MLIYIDLDGTLCTTVDGAGYHLAVPIEENIDRVTNLWARGHTIVIWTARGTMTGIDYTNLTLKQLRKWHVRYHDLRFSKPEYDLYIGDKCKNAEEENWNENSSNHTGAGRIEGDTEQEQAEGGGQDPSGMGY